MSTLRVYACGGTGINLAAQWMLSGKSPAAKTAQVIGLDSSKNNLPPEQLFKVEHLEGMRGGGKDSKRIYPGAADFLSSVISQHKPGDFNVLLFSSAGATGALFGPLLFRMLTEKNYRVVCVIVGDTSSDVEHSNTVKAFKNLDNQRRALDIPVCFDYILNSRYKNRGEANSAVIGRLDLLSCFLTDEHEESDFEDISNLLTYSKFGKATASLTKIDFYHQGNIKDLSSTSVAGMSIYKNKDDISDDLNGVVYRVTGVFQPGTLMAPKDITSVHMVFDHNETVKDILKMIEIDADREVQSKTKFKTTDTLGSGGDDLNIEL